ncbi:phage capsid protein [Pseudodesulfovibrio indicus]|uniref:phage capsid protein n=1 Tax=Pseudodesulfovibrio indicus TaxID=1716143 RepID=UPI00292E7F79|nr:phage capsid protein [Pseudodesulfovibrio indicus]
MSTTVSNAFVTQYVEMVHQAYQAQGSKMRNTVRLQTEVEGSKCVFQKVGKGAAGKKTRHGNVPLMNLNHSNVSCTLSDWYAAEYIDKLDELKDKSDEKQVAANAGAWALGRKIDELIITKLEGATNVVAETASGLTKDKILQAFGTLNANDVPDDGHRFAVVGPHQWNELLNIQEFKSSDYAGEQYAWLKGTESRTWLGITWMFHTGLPLDESGMRRCYVYHRNAAGLAEGQKIQAFVDWVPEKAAHLVDHMLSAGACLIDPDGVVEIQCDDDAAIL